MKTDTKINDIDFSEKSLRQYAAKALAGRGETTLIKHIDKIYIGEANAMEFTEIANLVAKTFFKYKIR